MCPTLTKRIKRTHLKIQPWLFGYNAFAEANEVWDRMVSCSGSQSGF